MLKEVSLFEKDLAKQVVKLKYKERCRTNMEVYEKFVYRYQDELKKVYSYFISLLVDMNISLVPTFSNFVKCLYDISNFKKTEININGRRTHYRGQ